jgi:hypothetical protein
MDGAEETGFPIGLIVSEKDDQRYSLWGLIRQAEDIQNSLHELLQQG